MQSLSLRQKQPVSYAFKVLNSQETVFHYKKRMKYFFDYLRLPGSDLESQGQAFISNATTTTTTNNKKEEGNQEEERKCPHKEIE